MQLSLGLLFSLHLIHKFVKKKSRSCGQRDKLHLVADLHPESKGNQPIAVMIVFALRTAFSTFRVDQHLQKEVFCMSTLQIKSVNMFVRWAYIGRSRVICRKHHVQPLMTIFTSCIPLLPFAPFAKFSTHIKIRLG